MALMSRLQGVVVAVVSIAIRFGLVRRFCSPGFCPVWGFRGFCYPVRRMFARFLRCIVVVVFILFPVPEFGLVGCHMRACVCVDSVALFQGISRVVDKFYPANTAIFKHLD